MFGGEPKIGQLLNSAWTYADVCRFQILTPPQIFQSQNINSSSSKSCSPIEKSKETADRIDMPPPPSPASSTCSETGSTVQSSSKYIFPFLLCIKNTNNCLLMMIFENNIYL